jgi:hypothetical protein
MNFAIISDCASDVFADQNTKPLFLPPARGETQETGELQGVCAFEIEPIETVGPIL